MMKVVVCIKQVPDTTEVRIDPRTNTLVREGVESIMNPYDQFALEQAVKLKESCNDTKLIALSMGPPQARKALLKALSLGADEALLLSDRAFAGSDTWATSVALSSAIRTIENVDIIFCGLQAIDGDTAQVGPETAQLLDIPQVTYVESLEVHDRNVIAIQQTENGSRKVEVSMPVLLTCIPDPSYLPRIPPFPGIVKATKAPYDVWSADKAGAEPREVGLEGSPTHVSRTYSPPPRGEVNMIAGDPKEAGRILVRNLIDSNIISKEVK